MLCSEVLGKAMDDAELEELRAEPGTLEQRHWERVAWEEPVDESFLTWFLANASENDKSQEAKFVCRSLASSLDVRRVSSITQSKT